MCVVILILTVKRMLCEVNIVPDDINENNSFENAFYAEITLLETELQARSIKT